MYADKSMHRTFRSIQRHYRDVKGRFFVSYESYAVLLKYMWAVKKVGVPFGKGKSC